MHALKLYLESRLLATFYRSELRSKCAQQTGVRYLENAYGVIGAEGSNDIDSGDGMDEGGE